MPRLTGTLRLIGEIILRLAVIATIIGVGFLFRPTPRGTSYSYYDFSV